MTIWVSAPAKTNLVLSVGPPRADGYHDLATVFHALDLRDRVGVRSGSVGSGVQIQVVGIDADSVPTDGSNLVAKAAHLLAAEFGLDPDVEIHIDKAIPIAGGLAGGSADAAATLVALDSLWHLGLSREQLEEFGARLGSDVPFSLHGGTMLGLGRGEHLTPILTTGDWHWVIAVSAGGLSTPTVYRELDRLRGTDAVAPPSIADGVLQALRSQDVSALGAGLVNDLQPAAIRLMPSLAQVLVEGDDAGAIAGVVSGSGPTVVFLARDREHAIDLAVILSASGLMRRVHAVSGGAPGAVIEAPGSGPNP